MRKHLGTLLKLALTIGGLLFVLSQIDLDTVRDHFLQTDLRWVLATFLLVNLGLVVRAFRWLVLLQGLKMEIKLSRLIALYYVGNFFNTFLPTSFGGDVMRVVEVARDVPADVAAGTVIVDRLSGLLTLFIMALFALPFRPATFPDNLLLLVIALSVGGIIASAILLEGSLLRRFGRRLPALLSPTGDGPVARLLQAVAAVGWPALLRAMIASFVFNLILISWYWTSARALGFHVPYSFLFLVVPILSVTLLLPAIGGYGPREAVATVLFDRTVLPGMATGFPVGTGFAISTLAFLVERLSGLPGGFIYLWMILRGERPGTRPDQPSEAEKTKA
jgi:uncharacterized membrane protein YbhN (UPF0104 family)